MITEYAKIPGLLACKNCVFWTLRIEKHSVGGCHRHAPVLANSASDRNPVSKWPNTFGDEFCGEFIRKEDNGQPTVS